MTSLEIPKFNIHYVKTKLPDIKSLEDYYQSNNEYDILNDYNSFSRKITWHGPGQIVGYPILRLAKPTELVAFVREIESALIDTCSEFGLHVQRIKGRSGVWVSDKKSPRKIAAIGIRVAKGTTMHGFALNVNPDLTPFTQIIPCGISDAEVTSMAQELGREITPAEVLPILERNLLSTLSKVCV